MKNILIILSLFFSVVAYGQEEGVEEMLKDKLNTLRAYKKAGDLKGVFQSYQDLAQLYREQEIYPKALQYYHLSLDIQTDDSFLLEQIAETHALQLNFDSSRYYRNKLVDENIHDNNMDGQLFHLQKIANTYSEEEDFKQSIISHQGILAIAQKNNDQKNIATTHNNIGIAQSRLGDYAAALLSLQEAEKICGEKPIVDLSILYSNIGVAYHNLNNDKKSIAYLLKAIEFSPEGETQYQLQHQLAKVYLMNDDTYNANLQNDLVKKGTKNQRLKSQSLKTAADIQERLYEFEEAYKLYQQHLELEQQFNIVTNFEKQRLLELKTQLERSEKEIQLELAAREADEIRIKTENERLAFEKREVELEKEKLNLEKEKQEKELKLLGEEKKVRDAEILAQQTALKTKELESEAQRQQLALAEQKLKSERDARELQESQRQQQLQQLELQASQDREKIQEGELETARKEKEAQEAQLAQEKKLRNLTRMGMLIGGIVSALIIGLVLWFLRVSNRKNKRLAQQNEEIEQQRSELEKSRDLIEKEREKSDELLLNILPGAIANELKEKGFATPKEYKEVTVLFTDFGGFTSISANMDADELIHELNTCFKTFDDIIEKYGIQPIKTIGDSYMCAGGVPIEGSTSPTVMVKAALEINAFMNQRLAEKTSPEYSILEYRIGLHTGPVIAGVVGKKKFAYDIWGDAVNTASRMESGAESNTVNISEATYQHIKDDFDCTFRGTFKVKNKGEMRMYRVEG